MSGVERSVGIVRKQDDQCPIRRRHTGESTLPVGSPAPEVVDTHQYKVSRPFSQLNIAILQHLNSYLVELPLDTGGIDPVVVITQYGIDAQGGACIAKCLGQSIQSSARAYKIAHQHNQIGMMTPRLFQAVASLLHTKSAIAQVNIGKHRDTHWLAYRRRDCDHPHTRPPPHCYTRY